MTTFRRSVEFEANGLRYDASYSVNGTPASGWSIEDVGLELLVETEDGRWLPAKEPVHESVLAAAELAAANALSDELSEARR